VSGGSQGDLVLLRVLQFVYGQDQVPLLGAGFPFPVYLERDDNSSVRLKVEQI